MTRKNPEIDERTVAVENRAGYLASQTMMWLLVLDMGLKSWRPEWTDWNGFPADIVFVLMAGGAVQTVYSLRARVYGARRVRLMALSALAAAAVAAAVMQIIKALL